MEQQMARNKHILPLPPRKQELNSPADIFDTVKNKYHKATQMKNKNVLLRDKPLQWTTYVICDTIKSSLVISRDVPEPVSVSIIRG
jgi:hypothetical protein